MAEGLICTCTLVDKSAKPGGEGIYRYTYECTWNEGDTNRYTISVDGTSDELAARGAEGAWVEVFGRVFQHGFADRAGDAHGAQHSAKAGFFSCVIWGKFRAHSCQRTCY